MGHHFQTFAQAVEHAHTWSGRCSVTYYASVFFVVSGSRPNALYVTMGMVWKDWERGRF
jgi:hypothetical protein